MRVGADYYIATSTFEWFPGVRLHHSRDLVHWRFVGYALTRSSQLDLRGVPDSGGVWAPSLSYADGQFWLVTTNVRTCGLGRPFKDLGIYLTTAPSIEGPWSEPIALNSIGFDPSLFHDDDGRKWLANMMWDFRQTGVAKFAGIVVQEYDPRQRRLVGPMTKLLEKPVLIEGPNLYRHGGWYYLMLAEGGTGWNHGISMARSRHLLGPYELDPQAAVLTTRDVPEHPLQKAGHGELVTTPTGEWYLVHLASRPVGTGEQRRCILGRETCLQQVRWSDDGWLRLVLESGADSTRAISCGRGALTPQSVTPVASRGVGAPRLQDGESWGSLSRAVWHPAVQVAAPDGVEPSPWPLPAARDDFDGAVLEASWSALRGPMTEDWASLAARPGWLRLSGRDSLHSLFAQSLVAKPLRSLRCVAETCVEFAPNHFTQMAGLVCYYDTRTHYYLRITHDETQGRVLGLVMTDDGVYREPATKVSRRASAGGAEPEVANEFAPAGSESADQISVEGWKRCFLRAVFDGTTLRFAASPDGQGWQTVGSALDASKLSDDYGSVLHFTGTMVGLCAQDLGGSGAFADFDYFSLTDETHEPRTEENHR